MMSNSFKHLQGANVGMPEGTEVFGTPFGEDIHIVVEKTDGLSVALTSGGDHTVWEKQYPLINSEVQTRCEGEYLYIIFDNTTLQLKYEADDVGLVMDYYGNDEDDEGVDYGYLTEEDIIGEEAYNKKYGLD